MQKSGKMMVFKKWRVDCKATAVRWRPTYRAMILYQREGHSTSEKELMTTA
jgi:hypothetical protein